MSGVEILGIIASATQLVDLGIRIVAQISHICRQVRNHPRILSKRLHSVEQLIQIARVIQLTKQLDTEHIHSILDSTIEDARSLLIILESLAPTQGIGKARQCWQMLCGIAKEARILELLHQIKECKGALLLCIGVANSKLLSTVDRSILDLSLSAQDAFREMPSIQQTVQHISSQLQDLITMERSGHINQPSWPTNSSPLIRAVDIALSGQDNRLGEIMALQESTLQLESTISKAVQSASRNDDSSFPAAQLHSSTPSSPQARSGSVALQESTEPSEFTDITLNNGQTLGRPFLVPVSHNPLFTGRADIIRMIETFYLGDPLGQKRLVLTGLGGVGKTQIATAFAYQSYTSAHYSTVLWIFATNRDEVLKSFTRIAMSLGLYPESGTAESVEPMPHLALELLRWLSRDHAPRWLLIFDNVDDLDSFDITEFFPKVPWGNILITSRCRQADRLGRPIVVDVMDSDDAVELLYTCSGIPVASDDVAAKHLVEALGFLPLALDQAGAYISGQCLSFNEYMELYGESRGHLLRHKPPKAVWCYEETVFTTWEISFAAVSKTDTLATKLLDVAAFFHSDDVPFALLCPLTQNLRPGQRLFLGDFLDFVETRLDYSQIIGSMCNELRVSKISVKQAIGRLESLSLVRRKKESQSILIHPLVHFWLRERQSDSQRFENSRVAICLVLYALINAYDLSQFRDAEAIYPYLFICLEQVYETPRLMSPTELQKLGACIIAVDSWVPFSIDPSTLRRADCFYDFISNKRAEAAWVIPEAMLAMRRALRLKSIGHQKKTSEHCSKFLETFEQRSQFDKMYAACIARIAAPCCYRMGDYDGAEKVYGYIDDSLDSTGTMLARKQLVLGAIKIDRGLPLDAEVLLSACASELVRGIGHEHFLLRVWHQLMATCFMAQGRLREAEETVLQQLNARLEQFDMSKIEFTFSDYELVEVYERILRKQRRHKEGRVLLARLLTNARSKAAKPEQALAELSLALTELDEKTWLYEPSSPVESQNEGRGIEIEALIADAYVAYEAAAVAYELEWNRGTWVFKHFHATMDEYRQRLESGITGVGTATAEDRFETD